MSESTDDIASLFEADLAKFSALPVAQSEAVSSATAAAAIESAKAIQAALAAELLSLNAAHEELIRHYMPLNSIKALLA